MRRNIYEAVYCGSCVSRRVPSFSTRFSREDVSYMRVHPATWGALAAFIFILLSVAVAATLGYNLSNSGPDVTLMAPKVPGILGIPTPEFEEEELPYYPDAQGARLDNVFEHDYRRIVYTTSAELEEVVEFYKGHLTKSGWTSLYENRNSRNRVMSGYLWSDPQNERPWDLIATIIVIGPWTGSRDLRIDLPVPIETPWKPSMSPPTPANEEGDRQEDTSRNKQATHVNVSLSKEPILERIPFYPGAEQIERVRDDRPSRLYRTYVVSATPTQIIEYYRARLLKHGWQWYKEDADGIAGSIRFGWHGGWRGGAVLDITTEAVSDGRTKVKMIAR